MGNQDRRTFIRRAAGAVPGAAIAGSLGMGACAPEGDADGASPQSGSLPEGLLEAVADVALPSTALDEEGMSEAVQGFQAWVESFEPAAELDHPYLTGELRYGLPHPGPRWAAQLEAMELESVRRSGISFSELGAEERRTAVERALRGGSPDGLPRDPAQAHHVVVGLIAWFYGTSQANDLCYRAEVGRHACRGTESLAEEPRAMGGEE